MIFFNKEEGLTYFKKLNYNIKEGFNWFIIIPFPEEIEQYGKINRYHTSYIKTCKICNNNFNHGLKNTLVCGCCKLFIKCNNRNVWFEKERNSLFINEIQNQKEIIAFCSQQCAKSRNGKLTGRANAIKFNEKVKSDPKLSKMMYEARSYVGRNFGKKNIYKALESLQNEHREILVENGYKVQQWLNNHPNERIRINTKNALKAGEANKKLWKDETWAKKQKEICLKNLEKAHEMFKFLWENDNNWKKDRLNFFTENGKKNGKLNLEKAKLKQLESIKNDFKNLHLKFYSNSLDVSFENIKRLCKNDICGAYILKGKFKEGKDNQTFNLLVCKSKKVYSEIYWILRVLAHPEKQDRYNKSWAISKWWYISNLYQDFEFVLLTDPNGVPEDEALLAEAKYAIDNNLFVEFNEKHEPNIQKHCYFSL